MLSIYDYDSYIQNGIIILIYNMRCAQLMREQHTRGACLLNRGLSR